MNLFRTPNNSLGNFSILGERRTYLPQDFEYNADGKLTTPDINYRAIVYRDNATYGGSYTSTYTRITYGWYVKWFFGDKVEEYNGDLERAFADEGFDYLDFTPTYEGVQTLEEYLNIQCIGGVPSLEITSTPSVLNFEGLSTQTLILELSKDCLSQPLIIKIPQTLPLGISVDDCLNNEVKVPIDQDIVEIDFSFDNSDTSAVGNIETITLDIDGGSADFNAQDYVVNIKRLYVNTTY